jgi:quercetin dioxygenase-like cupin family protein
VKDTLKSSTSSLVPHYRLDTMPAEQLTYILSGALHFWFDTEGVEQEIIVRAGVVVVIPSNLPHRAVALEDTLDVDVFCPPRQDWLSGTDAYLRG